MHVQVKLDGLILDFADLAAVGHMHGPQVELGPKRPAIALWPDDANAVFARLIAGGVPAFRPLHCVIGRPRAA